ncbi:MAG: PAS domain S-box protein, partial [Betaproteobacteria bacterium]|nr:PAS domain S-box protein [Betaproteobacteria bacterium]
MTLTPRHVAWCGGAFIAIVIGLSGYDIYRNYQATVADTGRELDTQARIIAEQTARSLQAVDVVLRHLAEQWRNGQLAALSQRQQHNYLREQAIGLVQIEGLILVDPAGNSRATSLAYPVPTPRPNVSKLPLFQVLRAKRDGGTLIGTALQSDVDGAWVLPIGRRVENANGEFAGGVGARGKVAYFQNFYSDLRLEPGTRVSLMHRNGTLIARHPAIESAIGKRFPMFDDILTRRDSSAGLPLRTVSPIDGVDRFGSVQLVPDYPVAVIVSRDATTALAHWRAQSARTAMRTLALSALAALLIWLLHRQFARLYKTQASLSSMQERYSLAVAGSHDGIWDYDFAAGQVFASARCRQLSGLPPGPEAQSIDEWSASLRVHPEDEPRRLAARDAHLSGRTPAYEGEWRMLHPDGTYRWVRLHGLCIRDAQGKPYRMAGSIIDIDATKRAEEALRAGEERYALAVAGSDDGIWDFDFAARRVFASARARELSGLASGPEMQSMDEWFASLPLHPEDAPKRIEAMEAHLAGKTPADVGEYRLRQPDGVYRWRRIHGLSVRDAAGRPHRMAGSISDIDLRKRAEEALRTSEEQYRAIFNAAADALVLRDDQARVVDVNPAFLQISGYTREEVVSGTRWIFALPEMAELAREMHRRTIAGESVHFEMKARHKDGTLIDVEMRAVPIVYRGKPHALGMARDITAQKRAERERAQLEGQLLQAKKLEAIGTLAGGIAHDFNNILSAALGYGEMAQKEAPPGTPLKRHIDAVVSAGLRAKSLVERILAFSRSGMGERVPVHVQSVVSEALELVAASLPAHVRFARELHAGDATVMGDPTQIHQVVMNLCANGAQAMKSSGVLTVTLEVVDKSGSMAATSAISGGRYVRLTVRDTGSGIAPNVLERIFDPFFTTKGVGIGTGLGLSLVHGIVTELGGGIDVESEPGKGAAFTVYLPWSEAVAAPAAAEQAIARGAGETVLIVDDEEALVHLSEEMVARLGYEPVGFSSSTAALEAFRASPGRFHAVLSDESMPELTGCELARAGRAVRPDIPVVLMSGFVSPA